MMRLWFHVDGVWLCAPPKCGGTALYRKLLRITCEDVRATFSEATNLTEFYSPQAISRPAFLAVRDPVDRFMSLWRDKCRDGDANLPFLRDLSPDELMTRIECDWYGDAHWAPQAEHYRLGVTCVPYYTLLQWFGAREVNTTKALGRDPKPPVTRILKHYWRDVELVHR